MRPIPSPVVHTAVTGTNTVAAGIHRWNSPVPYLFGGLALMLGLIALALIILTCSYKRSSSSSDSTADDHAYDDEKSGKPAAYVLELEMEPKIVAIMPGDDIPTFILKKSTLLQ